MPENDVKLMAELDKLGQNIDEFNAKNDKRIEDTLTKIDEKAPLKAVAGLSEKHEELKKMLEDSTTTIESLKAQIKNIGPVVSTGSPKEAMCEAVGHLVLGKIAGKATSMEWLTRHNLAEGTTAGGGALVPDQYVPELIKLMESYGVFRSAARVVPMASDSQIWPKLDGDVTVYAPGEATSITASSPTFANVTLVAKKLAALCAVSSELAEDAALAVGTIVADSIARAFAKAEDQAGFLGDGSATYWGYTGITGAFQGLAGYSAHAALSAYGGLVTSTGNAYSETAITEIRTLMAVLPTYAEANAKIYCSKRVYYDILVRLADAAGGMLRTEYETAPGRSFYGYPVIFTDVMPKATANSQVCLILGDIAMGAYLGESRKIDIQQSKDVYFASDQIGIRGTERIAVNVFGQGTTTAAGPICGLITLAS